MLIVTGGAGFIGSNLVKALNARGRDDILVVDHLADGRKFANLAGARIADYLDRDAFRQAIRDGAGFGPVEAVFHQGACTDTTEWDGRAMLAANFEASKEIFRWTQQKGVPLIYASSAAVYGAGPHFVEDAQDLVPLNVYGWSKLLFDQWAARQGETGNKVVGLRYFNVYGPGEAHKGRMASVVHHFARQLKETGTLRLFEASHGVGDGEHRRDFVFVGDVVAVNLWAFDTPTASGLYNVGTATSRSFNDLARAVIAAHGGGRIEYIPMPADLAAAYQAYTQADIARLRRDGYAEPFLPIEEGVRRTLGHER
jgi:ADP-L-glycero-D-manno-heptose 6-epimerase